MWQQVGSGRARVWRGAGGFSFGRRSRCSGGCLVRAQAGGGERVGNGDDSVENGNESGGPGGGIGEEGGEGSGSGGGSRFSVLWNALARGSARYYSNLLNVSRSELGFDIGDAVDKLKARGEGLKEAAENVAASSKQRAKQLREELEEARKESQEALAKAQQNYWPRFVEWNRWELWKVSL